MSAFRVRTAPTTTMKTTTSSMKTKRKPRRTKQKARRSLSPDRRTDQELGDWRGETLARVRALIKQADPDVVEDVKWRGRSGMGARRHHLHRRDLQGRGEADLRQGRRVGGPRRACSTPASTATCGAPSTSARATDRREGVQGAHPRGRRAEHGDERPEEAKARLRTTAPPQFKARGGRCFPFTLLLFRHWRASVNALEN